MFSVIGRSLTSKCPSTSISAYRTNIPSRANLKTPFLTLAFPTASRGHLTPKFTTACFNTRSEIIEPETEETEKEVVDLIGSLKEEIDETENSASFAIPEEYQLTRDGDNVTVRMKLEGDLAGKSVIVNWNSLDGPSVSEYRRNIEKQEREYEREAREQQKEEAAEQEGAEENEANEEADEDLLDDDENLEEKDITFTVNIKNGSDTVVFKCSASTDGSIFLDSVTTGDKTLDDINSLNEQTIEGIFQFLEDHGVSDSFGRFVHEYNCSRKMKNNAQAIKALVSFLQKE